MSEHEIKPSDEPELSPIPELDYDIDYDDEFSDEEMAKYVRKFVSKWTEKGGIPNPGEYNARKEEEEDDDIGGTFTTTDQKLANTNRDIGRLINNARLLWANHPKPPSIVAGHKMVLLDRARRVAMGDARPAPMSLTQGLDGGVNRALFRQRRSRPEDYQTAEEIAEANAAKTRRKDLLPRRRGDTGTKSVGVLPTRFSVKRPAGASRPSSRVTKGKSALKNGRTIHSKTSTN